MGFLDKYYHRLSSSPENCVDHHHQINASIHGFIPIPDDELEIISITTRAEETKKRKKDDEEEEEDEEVIGTTVTAQTCYGINIMTPNKTMAIQYMEPTTTTTNYPSHTMVVQTSNIQTSSSLENNNFNTGKSSIVSSSSDNNGCSPGDDDDDDDASIVGSGGSDNGGRRFKAIIRNRTFKLAMLMLLALSLTFITVSGLVLGVGFGTNLFFRRTRRMPPTSYKSTVCPGARETIKSMNHRLFGINTLRITGRGPVKIITTPVAAHNTVRVDVKSFENMVMMPNGEQQPPRGAPSNHNNNNNNNNDEAWNGEQRRIPIVRSALFIDKSDPSVLVLNTDSREEVCSRVISRLIMLPLGAQNLRVVFDSADPFESSKSAKLESVEFVRRGD